MSCDFIVVVGLALLFAIIVVSTIIEDNIAANNVEIIEVEVDEEVYEKLMGESY